MSLACALQRSLPYRLTPSRGPPQSQVKCRFFPHRFPLNRLLVPLSHEAKSVIRERAHAPPINLHLVGIGVFTVGGVSHARQMSVQYSRLVPVVLPTIPMVF